MALRGVLNRLRPLGQPVLVRGLNQSARRGPSSRNKALVAVGATMLTGVCAYIYVNREEPRQPGYFEAKKRLDELVSEPTLKIDLNEVYEQGAIVFLSNMDLIDAIGVPIKITSTKSDDIREVSLRREGKELYSLAKYRLEGAKTNGTVRVKSKYDKAEEKFKCLDVKLELDRPTSKGLRELVILKNGEPVTKKD